MRTKYRKFVIANFKLEKFCLIKIHAQDFMGVILFNNRPTTMKITLQIISVTLCKGQPVQRCLWMTKYEFDVFSHPINSKL